MKRSLSVVLPVLLPVLLLSVHLVVDIGEVTGAPTWIPSNVTFERVNETHVQVFYKEKLIETISVPEEEEATPPEPQLQPSIHPRPPNHYQRAGGKARGGDGIAGTKRPPPINPLKIEEYKRKWMRLNRCYFNPVTCFVGEKN